MQELTAFQFDLLASIRKQGDPKGLAVKNEVAESVEMYGEINHGRNYPNLNQLVKRGFVEKGEKDARTNYYSLTDKGRDVLAQRVADLERGL